MRPRSLSPNRTMRCPRIFDASTPVISTTRTVSSAPSPGIWYPSSACGWYCGGSSCSDWSMGLTISSSTQRVIASGIQMRSPVMRYFFIGRRALPGGVPRYGRTSAPLLMAADFDSVLLSDLPPDWASDFASGFVLPLSLASDVVVLSLASGAVVLLWSLPPAVAGLLASAFAGGFAPPLLKAVAYQ